MNKRASHAKMILSAASMLEPVEVTSPLPQECLRPAIKILNTAYIETEPYARPRDRNVIRTAALVAKTILAAVNENRTYSSDDVNLLRRSIESLRGIVSTINPKGTHSVQASQVPAVGLRFRSLAELTDAKPFVVLPARPQHALVSVGAGNTSMEDGIKLLRDADAMKAKLPSRLRRGEPFTVEHMPILAYPKNAINDSALNRTGLTWSRIADSTPGKESHIMHTKIKGERRDAILFLNQLVIGLPMEPEDAHEPDADWQAVVKQISRRMGEHINILSDGQKVIRSPGSHLRWMWLVPAHAMQSGLAISQGMFPWLSRATPEMQERDLDTLRTELDQLEKQQAVLIKANRSLSPQDLGRISQLREILHRKSVAPTPEQKQQKRDELKAEYLRRDKAENGKLAAELDEARRALKDIPKPHPLLGESPEITKERKQLTKQIKEQQAKLDSLREKLMENMRNKLKMF